MHVAKIMGCLLIINVFSSGNVWFIFYLLLSLLSIFSSFFVIVYFILNTIFRSLRVNKTILLRDQPSVLGQR
jgi:hypothetical protein